MQSDVISSFSKAANSYDKGAEFQYFAAQKLLDSIVTPPKHILDIGCGTGILTTLLKQKFKNIRCTLLDISPKMLMIARQKLGDNHTHYICGSADDIPFIKDIINTHHIDMIVSNLCFQWLNNPLETIKTYQSYAPVAISVLLDNSFYQWYASVKQVTDNFRPPVRLLPKTITDKCYDYHIQYQDALDFLRTQKNLGTLVNQNTSLTVKQLKNACKIFENIYDATISYELGIIDKGPCIYE
jgi:malonyl-CoA O-methyltransferase